ncbi:hypothetical protein CFC21_068601 [Triticum aestivum]|uniref:Bifunctional inhibitor/plant lipid transfer protein/seed storage helical domain-containing protein n=3 Tax=Triticum TaxID=4564 RepID=A0A9R1HAN9_WHEAT|nr:hypothetical protein CFC21_068600 [Triticum aestivum]KAF7061949.1 hypothetical protein CFC21_068601 [Triticum aestivum]VAI24221.1 unnamed protein product [Triticum turgidum subsp. durum]
MALIRSLLVLLLLLCSADASGTLAPAHAPATGLEAEKFCFGIGTNDQTLTCLANAAAACLATSAVVEESTFLACFVADAGFDSQCLAAGPPQHGKQEEHCIGIGISNDRMTCLGLVGWSCRGSRFGILGFVPCYLGSSMKCIV